MNHICPNTLPLSIRLLLKTQNYSPFLSQMTKGKSLRGRHLVITRRVNIILIIKKGLRRRRGRRSKTKHVSLLTSNGLTLVFIWHITSMRVSKKPQKSTCIHWSCSMMALKVTPLVVEEERVKKDAAEKGGAIGAPGSVVSTRPRFDWSWASLRWIEPMLMAPMMVKIGERGIGMEKC